MISIRVDTFLLTSNKLIYVKYFILKLTLNLEADAQMLEKVIVGEREVRKICLKLLVAVFDNPTVLLLAVKWKLRPLRATS